MLSIFLDRLVGPRIAAAALFLGGLPFAWLFRGSIGDFPFVLIGYGTWVFSLVRVFATMPKRLRRIVWGVSIGWHVYTLIPAIFFVGFVVATASRVWPFLAWATVALLISIYLFRVDIYCREKPEKMCTD